MLFQNTFSVLSNFSHLSNPVRWVLAFPFDRQRNRGMERPGGSPTATGLARECCLPQGPPCSSSRGNIELSAKGLLRTLRQCDLGTFPFWLFHFVVSTLSSSWLPSPTWVWHPFPFGEKQSLSSHLLTICLTWPRAA